MTKRGAFLYKSCQNCANLLCRNDICILGNQPFKTDIVVLVNLISNFCHGKISHADKLIAQKIPTCNDSALHPD